MTRLVGRLPGAPFIISSVLAVAVAVVVLLVQTPNFGPDVVAGDRFERTVSDGWGSDSRGGPYEISGTRADYGVERGRGSIVVPMPGVTRSALLTGVAERDVELFIQVRIDQPPSGTGTYVYGVMRHSADGREFRTKVRLLADGGVRVGVTALLGPEERDVAAETRVPGLTYAAGQTLSVRTRIEGLPGTVRVKVWMDGSKEPIAWTTRSNASVGLLVAPGGIGLRAYVSRTSGDVPVVFTFVRFEARRLAAPSPSGESGSPEGEPSDSLSGSP